MTSCSTESILSVDAASDVSVDRSAEEWNFSSCSFFLAAEHGARRDNTFLSVYFSIANTWGTLPFPSATDTLSGQARIIEQMKSNDTLLETATWSGVTQYPNSLHSLDCILATWGPFLRRYFTNFLSPLATAKWRGVWPQREVLTSTRFGWKRMISRTAESFASGVLQMACRAVRFSCASWSYVFWKALRLSVEARQLFLFLLVKKGMMMQSSEYVFEINKYYGNKRLMWMRGFFFARRMRLCDNRSHYRNFNWQTGRTWAIVLARSHYLNIFVFYTFILD